MKIVLALIIVVLGILFTIANRPLSSIIIRPDDSQELKLAKSFVQIIISAAAIILLFVVGLVALYLC